MILSELRNVEEYVLEELGPMPLIIDIRQNKVLGPMVAKFVEEAVGQADRKTLRRQLAKRFGAIPPSFDKRIESGTEADLERWLVRILDAPTLEAVFE